ncbi:MAG: SsrA-binding protein SmpB [Acidimicrobiia bacterium]
MGHSGRPDEVPVVKAITTNRRARHDYEITETFEAGIVLQGSEVKSLRAGNANLKDAYVMFREGEAWLIGGYIAPYSFSREGGHHPDRERKLLLHKKEIEKIASKVAERGLTLVPLGMYFKEGRAKVELGLGRGKARYDKRHALKEKQQKREMERAVRRKGRV